MSTPPFRPGDRVTVALRHPFTATRGMKGKTHHVSRCELVAGASPTSVFAWRVYLTGLRHPTSKDGAFAADDFALVSAAVSDAAPVSSLQPGDKVRHKIRRRMRTAPWLRHNVVYTVSEVRDYWGEQQFRLIGRTFKTANAGWFNLSPGQGFEVVWRQQPLQSA